MARSHRSVAVALAAAGILTSAACGDTGEETGAAVAEGTDCGSDPGQTVTVEIPEFAFDPDPVSVDRCDSIVWVNAHTQPHTSTGEGGDAWSTGSIAPGEASDPVRFDEAGTRTYICALHPFMTGTVEVS